MLNPDEDTEWNDVLRSKGILPPKQKEAEVTEDQIVDMLMQTIEKRTKSGKSMDEMDLDELDDLSDEEDENFMMEYRNKRLAEIRAQAALAKFGSVREISGQDYVSEVNRAGDGIWVVLHLYEKGIPHCALINQFMNEFAMLHPKTKFLRSIATTCIPNFPEKNLPAIFVYYEGEMKKQFLGKMELRGTSLTREEFEFLIGGTGAIETKIKEDPRKTVKDKMFSDLADTNDW